MMDIDPARYYKSAMDSVNLINSYLSDPPAGMDGDEVADAIDRNVRHLQIVVGKDFWTDEDLTPFHDAIAAAE